MILINCMMMMNVRTNCQICGDCGKTLKFVEVAQIHQFCESREAREKFTALIANLKLHCIGFVGTAQELHIQYVTVKALLESTSSKFYVCRQVMMSYSCTQYCNVS